MAKTPKSKDIMLARQMLDAAAWGSVVKKNDDGTTTYGSAHMAITLDGHKSINDHARDLCILMRSC